MKNRLYTFCAALFLAATCAAYGQTKPSQDADGTYLIGTADELKWFRDQVNNETNVVDDAVVSRINARLTADIDLSEAGDWTPIGTYHGEPDILYYGTFDGDGHVIKGLTVNPIEGREDSYGLFGIVNGTVKNLGIVESTVTGGCYVGAICGMLSYGTIENCYSTATVTAQEDAGGLTGGMRKTSRAVNSYNAGTVTSTGENAQVGGITSYIGSEASVENCYNVGTVTGTGPNAEVGAIAGDDYHDYLLRATKSGEENGVVIIDCYYLEGTGSGYVAKALSASDFVTTINANLFAASSEAAPWKGEAKVEGGLLKLATFTEGTYSEVEAGGSQEPSSVDEISATESTVHAIDGRIVVTVAEPSDARVVGMAGQVVRVVHLSAGRNEIAGLPSGVYIVILGDGTRAKVLVR